jgi:ecotin
MVDRLPNGNTWIVNCHAGPENPQILEVTPDKKVVWSFKDFERFGNALPVAIPVSFNDEQSVKNLKAYPPAAEGQQRFVVHLEPQENEDEFRVEMQVGKTVETDPVNRFFFGGSLIEETVEGWGFPKFVVNDLGPMAGTLIGVDPNAPKVKRFITLGGEPKLLRYNSKLPLVIYVPKGVEVRYRIWKAEPNATVATEG